MSELEANRDFFDKYKPVRKICGETNKTCYKTKKEAREASKAFSRNYKPDHKTQAYFCKDCKYYHNRTNRDY